MVVFNVSNLNAKCLFKPLILLENIDPRLIILSLIAVNAFPGFGSDGDFDT